MRLASDAGPAIRRSAVGTTTAFMAALNTFASSKSRRRVDELDCPSAQASGATNVVMILRSV